MTCSSTNVQNLPIFNVQFFSFLIYFVHSRIRSSIHSFIHSFFPSLIQFLFLHSFIFSSLHSFIHLFVCFFTHVYSFAHLSLKYNVIVYTHSNRPLAHHYTLSISYSLISLFSLSFFLIYQCFHLGEVCLLIHRCNMGIRLWLFHETFYKISLNFSVIALQ